MLSYSRKISCFGIINKKNVLLNLDDILTSNDLNHNFIDVTRNSNTSMTLINYCDTHKIDRKFFKLNCVSEEDVYNQIKTINSLAE